jgi:eukaryotic-like serine/threonine-protein kinase
MTLLTQGIQSATQALMDEGFAVNDVLQSLLQTMLQALGARRAVLCLRDRRNPLLLGRLALGAQADVACRAMRIDLAASAPDLLAAVCLKGADLLVEDASVPGIASRLPTWWRPGLDAAAFLLLPMRVKGAPIGLIYLDHAQRGGIHLAERELALMRSLRNQAVMALRVAGQA